MSAQLQIVVEGSAIDLFVNEENSFFISKQLYDLTVLSTRNASYSKTITIPLTPTNISILGENLPRKARYNDDPYKTLDCEVLVSGVPMISDAYLVIGVEDVRAAMVSITIYGGTAKFFNELTDSSIRNLNFSEFNIEWTLAGVTPILETTTGITYANSQWFTNLSYRQYDFSANSDDAETYMNHMELGETGLFMFLKTILDKIFESMPLLTVDDSAIIGAIDPKYEELALAVNVPVIHDSFGTLDGSYSEVQLLGDYALFPEVGVVTKKFPEFLTVIENTSGHWSVANQRYEFTQPGFFRIKFAASGTYKDTTRFGWNVRVNSLQVLAAVEIPPTVGGSEQNWDTGVETTMNAVPGDFLEMYYFVTNIDTGAEALVTFAQFIIEQEGAGRPTNIDIASLLPDISQREFVKQVFNNLCIVPTEEANVVKLILFENIRSQPLGQTLDFDISRGVKLITSFPTYGRTNHMLYASNPSLERADYDGFFPVNSLALQKEATAIQLAFSASDKGDAMVNSNDRCVIPAYAIEYNFVNDNKMSVIAASTAYTTTTPNNIIAGDFVSYNDGGTWLKRRVATVNDDVSGSFETAAVGTNNSFDWHHWRYNAQGIGMHVAVINTSALQIIDDGGQTLGALTQNIARFDDSQKWGIAGEGATGLLKTHYSLITDSVYKPFAFEAWAVIPVAKFAGLNELDIIYVEEFAAHFYINIIDQWKPNQLCRVTLVEVKI